MATWPARLQITAEPSSSARNPSPPQNLSRLITVLVLEDSRGARMTPPSQILVTPSSLSLMTKISTMIVESQNANAYNKRGELKRSQGDLDGAIADFTAAIGLDPKLASAYKNRGDTKQAKGDSAGANKDL